MPRVKKVDDVQAGFYPDLNPTQNLLFNDTRPVLLAAGEKGSGKSYGCATKVIRHLYDEANALGWIISPVHLPTQEGVWYDMETVIAPEWEAAGVKFQFQYERKSKHTNLWVTNRHGGASKLLLYSIPYASQVRVRCKGPAPSIVYVEEITDCSSQDYFRFPAAQLGRRQGIVGPQQFLASCNPAGPSHWVYKTFVEPALAGHARFGYYHFPITENVGRLPPGYVDHLESIFGQDVTMRKRLIEGQWVEAPSGDAIFKETFIPEIHQIGDLKTGIGLLPLKELPIIVGYDLGPINFSCQFMQNVPSAPVNTWIVFDEINFVGKPRPYHTVVPVIIERMEFWKDMMQTEFMFDHISSDESFTNIRSDGSFDAAEFEKLSDGEIRFRGCPRPSQSVPARVRMIESLLQQEAIYISALCPKTCEMFRLLESESVPAGEYDPHAGYRPKRSPYIHPFDSLSYPIFYYTAAYRRYRPRTGVTARAYRCGEAA